MKKLFFGSLLLISVVLFGCSDKSTINPSKNESTHEKQETVPNDQKEVVLKLDTLQEKFYFTRYENENMAVLHYYAEVQNNGNTDILLEDFLLTAEDSEGNVISSVDFGQTTTRIIYSGEKAYFAQNMDINNISDIEKIVKVYNTPIFNETNHSYNSLEFENVQLQDSETDVYSIMGKFISKHQNLPNASVSSVLFDENNELLAVLINDFSIPKNKINQPIPFGLSSNLYLPESLKGKAKTFILVGRAYEFWDVV